MLNRLKSLPLTIVLTVLIWMYAEAQFTAQQDKVPVNVQFIAPRNSPLAVQVLDPPGGQFTVSLQGPKALVEHTVQQAQGVVPLSKDDLDNLKVVLTDNLPPGLSTYDSKQLLNSLSYFKSRGITVTDVVPRTVKIDAEELQTIRQRLIAFRTGAVTLAGPVRFLSPATGYADVTMPRKLLQAIGGPDKVTVYAVPLKDLAGLPSNVDQTVPAHVTVDYPGPPDPRVTVTPEDVTVQLKVAKQQEHTLSVADVPVLVAGPPDLLKKYDVVITPPAVKVTVAGPEGRLNALAQAMTNPNAPIDDTARAYLDVGNPDAASTVPLQRPLRYVLPDAVQLRESPHHVQFKLVPKPTPAESAP